MGQLKKLEVGQKYTLVRMGEMGFLFSLQITLLEIKVGPFAQYSESLMLIFKKRGARHATGTRFLPHDDYLVYEGWVSVKTDMFVSHEVSGTGLLCRTSLLSFDRKYFEIAKQSVAATPILEQITPCPASDTARILAKTGRSA